MALVYDGILCAVCETTIDIGAPYFATGGVFLPPWHPLTDLCDTALHWFCFEHLPQREEFERAYLHMWIDVEHDSPYWGKAFVSSDALVTVNRELAQVNVRLREACVGIRLALDDWEDWLNNAEAIERVEHPLEQQAVRVIRPRLRDSLPTIQTLLDAVNWEAKQQARERRRQQTRVDVEERLRKPKFHNKACRALLRDGVTCPFCSTPSPEYVDRSPQAKSEFICQACGRTFGPVDVTLKQLYG